MSVSTRRRTESKLLAIRVTKDESFAEGTEWSRQKRKEVADLEKKLETTMRAEKDKV